MQQDADSQRQEDSTDRPTRMTRQQTLTLISMASVNFSSMICYSILGPFFPIEAEKKGASQMVVGIIFGCYAVSNLIGSLILGRYIVQIGAKMMLIMGLFLSSGCTILFGLLDRVPAGPAFIALCIIVRSVDAVGFAAAMTSSFALSAKVFPNNVATVLGSLEVFTGLGLILGPPVGGWFYQSFGYEVPFMLLGCFLLVMVPLNIYILPSIDAVSSKASFFQLLKNVKIVLLCYVIFTLSSGLGFLDATLSLYAVDQFHLSAGYVGLIMLGLSFPYCLGSPLMGIFTDKYPVSVQATATFSKNPSPSCHTLGLQEMVHGDRRRRHGCRVPVAGARPVPLHPKASVAAGPHVGDNRVFPGYDRHPHIPRGHHVRIRERIRGGTEHSGNGIWIVWSSLVRRAFLLALYYASHPAEPPRVPEERRPSETLPLLND
ncbi:MFS-type transporter SLC18B1 isoform X3 [Dunckerocampus dactyliophorus]|uniref:MFS-type transporter SLC18B1 isoform X3 n=1 Tax=Dunckerocampus dactyliophorus TaxID=161453 RepID=UPI002407640F|nr:MFS-type transporter SLC18B1 isoform X3 [Dunckerocampus dactyliophorus]